MVTCYQHTVNLPDITLENSTSSPQVGAELTFVDDPGLGFEIQISHIVFSFIISELHMTAVRQLNGVMVECLGGSGNFTSIIQIAPVAEYSNKT